MLDIENLLSLISHLYGDLYGVGVVDLIDLVPADEVLDSVDQSVGLHEFHLAVSHIVVDGVVLATGIGVTPCHDLHGAGHVLKGVVRDVHPVATRNEDRTVDLVRSVRDKTH